MKNMMMEMIYRAFTSLKPSHGCFICWTLIGIQNTFNVFVSPLSESDIPLSLNVGDERETEKERGYEMRIRL